MPLNTDRIRDTRKYFINHTLRIDECQIVLHAFELRTGHRGNYAQDFTNKVVSIAGGSRVLGAVSAALLLERGALVVITDILDELGERHAAKIGATYLHHDVSSETDWARVHDRVCAGESP